MPGAAGNPTNSMSFSEFSVTSDPLDTGRYNRFNEKEKKEREKEAENWIPAVSKSGLKVAGRNPELLHRLSKGNFSVRVRSVSKGSGFHS